MSHWRPCQDCTKKAFHRRRAARNCEGQSGLARLVDLLSVIWLWSTAVDSGLIATWSVLLVNTKDLLVWSTADIESLQIEIQAALCTLGEESLKEVCSGLKTTLPPESKGRLVSIWVLNKYLETAELDYEKLKGLPSSLSTQEKEGVPKEKTEPPEAPENNKATVKVEQNFKMQTGLQDFGPDLGCVSEGSAHFFLASTSKLRMG